MAPWITSANEDPVANSLEAAAAWREGSGQPTWPRGWEETGR